MTDENVQNDVVDAKAAVEIDELDAICKCKRILDKLPTLENRQGALAYLSRHFKLAA